MTCKPNIQLQALIQRAMAQHQGIQAPPRSGPVPILWFGDLEAYCQSDCRIVTVGKNPSDKEFPASSIFQRFPALQNTVPNHSTQFFSAYTNAMNQYFGLNPYWGQWFKSFDDVLAGFDASYRPGRKNTAIHTDLFSPIATSPIWGKLRALNPQVQPQMAAQGLPLWHDLLDWLAPHIVIFSFARNCLQSVSFPLIGSGWQAIPNVVPPKNNVLLHSAAMRQTGHCMDFVFGTGAQSPFGMFAGTIRQSIGAAARPLFHSSYC